MREKRKLFSSLWDLPYGSTTRHNLFDTAKNSKEFVQKLQLQRKIPVHDGCVNSICWNDTGKYLLSGSDDQRLSVVHGYDYSVLAYIPTGHRANIFSAKFLPSTDDKNVVSCSGDGIIIYSHIERPETSLNNKFTCHKGTTYELMTVPNDPNTFLSCGEDKTVRWFDVRTKTSCNKEDCKDDILIHGQTAVTSLAINPYTPYQLALGCADASVRMFDRRMLCTQNASGFSGNNGYEALMTCFSVPEFVQSRRITSLCYSADGQEILVSYSSDYIYLFDIRDDLNKKPRLLSCDGSSAEADSDSSLYCQGRPLVKRLRIRGDWSDTGPNARPEAEARVEGGEDPNASRTTIVRTMTDILTRMFHTSQNRTAESAASQTAVSTTEASQTAVSTTEASQTTPMPSEVSNLSSEIGLDSDDDNESRISVITNVQGPTSTGNQSADDSNVGDQCNPSTSRLDQLSQPSTSGMTPKPHDENEAKTKRDNLIKYMKMQKRNRQSNEVSSTDSIKKEIESRRKDLIDKHHTEPMVNLHYSGQSVSSGQITMDVATSSTANERQWLEQSVDHLPDLLPEALTEEEELPSEPPPPEPASSSFRELVSPVPTPTSTNSQYAVYVPVAEVGGIPLCVRADTDPNEDLDNAEQLLMEVDSWEDSDDDEPTPRARDEDESRPRARVRRESATSTNNFMSLNAEFVARSEEQNELSCASQPRIKRKYTGHRNARTMIKESTFWGDNFVMSGSDCGHIFIWDRHTAELVMLMEADHHVVNCLQPHPFDPILASSGIDYDIKLWAPSREEPFFDVEKANEIIKRNEIMLEETKDTITVPASFMFRMFTTLNHFRTGRAYRWSRAAREMRAANADSSER